MALTIEVLSSVSEQHSLLGWYRVTDLVSEEYPISLPWETLGLLLLHVLGHCPSAIQMSDLSVLQHMAESEKRV